MNASSLVREAMRRVWLHGLRDLLPWIVAGACAWFLLVHWVPERWCRFRQVEAISVHLSETAPHPDSLRVRLERSLRDSAAGAGLRLVAASRQAGGSDPSSLVASLVVPRLESAGVRLQRVSAREERGEVLLSLSVLAGWNDLLGGFASLDSIPLAWTTRRLNIRPVDGFRLGGEVVLSVPLAPEAPE